MVDVVSPLLVTADVAYPAVFPFAMELVVVVLFAVVGFPIWLAMRVLESVREAR